MIGTFGGMQIIRSEHAVRRWTERRIRFEDFVWRGRKEWRSWIVTVSCEAPAAFQMGDTLVVHPVLYEELMRSAQLCDATNGAPADLSARVPHSFGPLNMMPHGSALNMLSEVS